MICSGLYRQKLHNKETQSLTSKPAFPLKTYNNKKIKFKKKMRQRITKWTAARRSTERDFQRSGCFFLSKFCSKKMAGEMSFENIG